jgi:tRNA 5-methylaminomethyl-2-thiouridine biosynthesis bifunctional protein
VALAAALGTDASDAARHDSRAGIRCVTPDYLPIVGTVADADVFRDRFAALSRDATTTFDTEAPWLGGLLVSTGHGSRGLVTAPIAGELVASLITGEPLPLSDRVVQALGAARFLARGLKRKQPIV